MAFMSEVRFSFVWRWSCCGRFGVGKSFGALVFNTPLSDDRCTYVEIWVEVFGPALISLGMEDWLSFEFLSQPSRRVDIVRD